MASVLDLVCVGRIVTETIVRPTGIEGPLLGGPPAYSALPAARQGVRVGLAPTIGRALPAGFLYPLGRPGVDATGVALAYVSTASAMIL